MTEIVEQADGSLYADVLDHGHAVLEAVYGDELAILANARVSFNSDVEAKTVAELSDRDVGVLNFLMEKRHGSPWEAVLFRFDLKMPIFVVREHVRHRISSMNEHSQRYSKAIEDFYIPDLPQIRTQVGKPGNYKFEPLPEESAREVQRLLRGQNFAALDLYHELLDEGVAKEVARTVLPVAMYSRLKWTINLRSLFNYFSLRSHETAQWEIRQFSLAMEKMVAMKLPLAMKLFNDNGRVAP